MTAHEGAAASTAALNAVDGGGGGCEANHALGVSPSRLIDHGVRGDGDDRADERDNLDALSALAALAASSTVDVITCAGSDVSMLSVGGEWVGEWIGGTTSASIAKEKENERKKAGIVQGSAAGGDAKRAGSSKSDSGGGVGGSVGGKIESSPVVFAATNMPSGFINASKSNDASDNTPRPQHPRLLRLRS